jgi:hypothetical protein
VELRTVYLLARGRITHYQLVELGAGACQRPTPSLPR